MFKPFADWWKDTVTKFTEEGAMKDTDVEFEKVDISRCWAGFPVVVVTSQFVHSTQQERVMKVQAFQNNEQISMKSGRKALEINPSHPVISDSVSMALDKCLFRTRESQESIYYMRGDSMDIAL